MRPGQQRVIMWMVLGVAVGWAAPDAAEGASAGQLCEARKLRAAGQEAHCLAVEEAKEVLGATSQPAKCSGPFETAFESAEAIAGPGVCPTEGDAAAIEAQIDACVANLVAALSNAPLPFPCQRFPATGQTTCSNSSGSVIACAGTGQDGNIRAGGALSYTDNGDGTITDNNTKLMWEKKSDDESIHDKDNRYTWDNAFAVHIAGLNTANFAGHSDWRLPNVKELLSIVNYQNGNPAVSPAFNTGCVATCTVLTCSCTVGVGDLPRYWSSTSVDGNPTLAYIVAFDDGIVFIDSKSSSSGSIRFVRAVRGGL